MNLSRLPRITPVSFEVNARTVRHGHPEWGRVGGRMTAGERNKRNSTRSVSPSAPSNPLCGFTFTFARTRPSARLPSTLPRFVYSTVLFTSIACHRYCGFFFVFCRPTTVDAAVTTSRGPPSTGRNRTIRERARAADHLDWIRRRVGSPLNWK